MSPTYASIKKDVEEAVSANKEEIVSGVVTALSVIVIPAAFKFLIDRIGSDNTDDS